MRPHIRWLVAAALVLPGVGAAEVPPVVHQSGLLVDGEGRPIEGAVDLRFALYERAEGGAPVWSESHDRVELVTGYYSVLLGTREPLTPAVALAAPWLGVTVDGEDELSPRVRLAAVPFALAARELVGGRASVTEVRVGGNVVIDARGRWVGDPTGLRGPPGPAGPAGPPGEAGPGGSPDTPEQVLAKLRGVDGADSELDADLLDGLDGSRFVRSDVRSSVQADFSVGGDLVVGGTATFRGGVDLDGGDLTVRRLTATHSAEVQGPLAVRGVAVLGGDVRLDRGALTGVGRVHLAAPGPGGHIAWADTQARIYVAPLDDGAGDGYLRLRNDEGVSLEADTRVAGALTVTDGGRFGGDVDLGGHRLQGAGEVRMAGPGPGKALAWAGTDARIFVAPDDGADAPGPLRLASDRGLRLEGDTRVAGSLSTTRRLGVATANPQAELDVVGNARISGTLTVNGRPVGAFDGGVIGNNLTIRRADPQLLLSPDGGSAGVLRSSAGLTLRSGGAPIDLEPPANQPVRFRTGAGGPVTLQVTPGGHLEHPGAEPFRLAAGGPLVLQAEGNVGVGVARPAHALEVDGTVAATRFVGLGTGLVGVDATTLGGLEAAAFLRRDRDVVPNILRVEDTEGNELDVIAEAMDVVIRGSGFGDEPVLKVGAEAVDVAEASDTRIRARIQPPARQDGPPPFEFDGNDGRWQAVDLPGRNGNSNWRIGNGEISDDTNVHGSHERPGSVLIRSDHEYADARMRVTIRNSDNDAAGVVLRYQSPTRYYYVQINNGDHGRMGDGAGVHLVRMLDGNVRKLRFRGTGSYQNRDATLEVEARGPRIRVSLNGNALFEVEDGTFDEGAWGLALNGSQTPRFRNISITPLGGGAGGSRLLRIAVVNQATQKRSNTIVLESGAAAEEQEPEPAFPPFVFGGNNDGNWQAIDMPGRNGNSRWEIGGGRITDNTNVHAGHDRPGSALVRRDRQYADAQLRFDLHNSDNDAAGAVIRLQDARNYFYVQVNNGDHGNMGDGAGVHLVRVVNNNPHRVAFSRTRSYQNVRITVQIIAVGDRIRVLVQGVQHIDARDGTFRSGRWGLATNGSQRPTFTNISIRPP